VDDSNFGFVGNQEKGGLGKIKTGVVVSDNNTGFNVSADGGFLLVN
jgi:hypothetical protein